jgi:anti-sigma regulatory factor (Ser/Thr protein kinase)
MPASMVVCLAPESGSVREAQDTVFEFCAEHGLDSARDVAVLLASELVTNVVLHARTDFELRVALRPDRLRVEVCDMVPAPPAIRMAAPDDFSGRGLGLLAALAGRWGVETAADGKSVWFELPV